MTSSASRLSALANLPAFPGIALQVLNLAGMEDADLRKLAALIEKDPAFSSDILRMANAPAFSVRGGIKSVTQAIAQIGLENLTSVTMTVAMRSVVSKAFRTPIARQCWQHCLACALISRQFGRVVGIERNEAYTLGLLHDIGRLGLLAAFPEEYTKLLQQEHSCEEDLLAAEESTFRVDHCAAGALLARNWKLPGQICDCASSHHQIPVDRKADPLALVYLACGLSRCFGYGIQFTDGDTVQDVLSVTPASLTSVVEPELQELSEVVEGNLVALA